MKEENKEKVRALNNWFYKNNTDERLLFLKVSDELATEIRKNCKEIFLTMKDSNKDAIDNVFGFVISMVFGSDKDKNGYNDKINYLLNFALVPDNSSRKSVRFMNHTEIYEEGDPCMYMLDLTEDFCKDAGIKFIMLGTYDEFKNAPLCALQVGNL